MAQSASGAGLVRRVSWVHFFCDRNVQNISDGPRIFLYKIDPGPLAPATIARSQYLRSHPDSGKIKSSPEVPPTDCDPENKHCQQMHYTSPLLYVLCVS